MTHDKPTGASTETASFRVERQEIEKGATFSQDALQLLFQEIGLFVMEHISARWDVTGQPPSFLNVTITTDVG